METQAKTKQVIPAQRCKDEGLDFIEERAVDDEGVTHVYYKIIDAAGVVYNAMLLSDGTVFDGYMKFDNTETYERFQGPADTLCGWWRAKWWHEIMRDRNGEIYLWREHKNVGPSAFMEHIARASELAEIMFDLHEQQILEFGSTGHWAVCLPQDVREELVATAYASREGKSRQEMIVERLRRPPSTEPSAPESVGENHVRSLVEKIRQRKAAATEPEGEVARRDDYEPREATTAVLKEEDESRS
jgi:hypothetical protein